jgi:mannose-6-phosphate isomerase
MAELYPLLMQPAFDPRPWGTLDLSPIYPNHRCEQKIGEAWLTGDQCRVANGVLRGKSLAELSASYGRELVGEAARDPGRFPLLLKFLFPHEKLSVQVHPDDQAAQRVGEPWGKTECWYVAHARPGAQIALGLKPGVSLSQFEQAIQDRRAEELLNWIEVNRGEMIYVAGGTVHTLGPGSVMVETQQQSDTTYRLYDYGRPRALHLRAGLAAVKETVISGKVNRAAPQLFDGGNQRSRLVAAPYFQVELYELKSCYELRRPSGKTSVQIMVALEGGAVVESQSQTPVTLGRGDAVVVPASIPEFRVRPQPSIALLKACVPPEAMPEPETRL